MALANNQHTNQLNLTKLNRAWPSRSLPMQSLLWYVTCAGDRTIVVLEVALLLKPL